MNAVELIESKVDGDVLLSYYGFSSIKSSDTKIRACCKIHGGGNNSAFVYNKESNLWYCHSGDCGGGNVFTLIQKLENVDFIESVHIAAKIFGVDIEDCTFERKDNKEEIEYKKWLSRQKKDTGLEEYIMPNIEHMYSHSTFNRFPEETLGRYGAFFFKELVDALDGQTKVFKDKLAIPIKKDGVIVTYALRDTTGEFEPKWWYHPAISMSNILYNFDTVKENVSAGRCSKVVIVEGIFDVWAYSKIGINNCVALMGSSLKPAQKDMLLKLGVDFVTSFDSDEAGNKCAQEFRAEMHKYSTVENVVLPDGYDPGDCTPEVLRKCYLEKGK